MDKPVLFPLGTSESCRYAGHFLEQCGFSLIDHPSPDVTHLLLDIPGTDNSEAKKYLRMLPKNITIIGGNLDPDFSPDYRKTDLLKDPFYLAKNAAITAECALQAAAPYLSTTFADSPVIILGWGRIGKCLAKLLEGFGCSVTVAARKKSDRAMAEAMGFRAVDFFNVEEEVIRNRLLFNTVPEGITLDTINDTCVLMDLASHPGLNCPNTIIARGLPGKFAPESSGKLIAESVCRLMKEAAT